MKPRICANDKCLQPFEPAFGQEQSQKYCSRRCSTRMRVKLCRDRKRYGNDGGGPGGGKRQPMLFSQSEIHRRKPAKSVVKPKPKQDDLFAEVDTARFPTFAKALELATDSEGGVHVTCYQTQEPSRSSNQSIQDADVAA